MLGENRSGRAIVLVDLINDYAHLEGRRYLPGVKDIIPYVQGELQYFRDRMRPVLFCNTAQVGAKNFYGQVIRELTPRTGEISINKNHPDAFLHTDLFIILKNLKVKTLTIVGCPLTESIILTAASALQLGFSVVVPETCVCARTEQEQATALRLLSLWSTDEILLKGNNSITNHE